jgi:hypothetical protein
MAMGNLLAALEEVPNAQSSEVAGAAAGAAAAVAAFPNAPPQVVAHAAAAGAAAAHTNMNALMRNFERAGLRGGSRRTRRR